MIFALIEFCIFMTSKIKLNKSALYAQTFTIFLLSWPFQAVINVLTEKILHWPYYLIMPIQFIIGITGPMVLISVINKIEKKYNIHWFSFSLGK